MNVHLFSGRSFIFLGKGEDNKRNNPCTWRFLPRSPNAKGGWQLQLLPPPKNSDGFGGRRRAQWHPTSLTPPWTAVWHTIPAGICYIFPMPTSHLQPGVDRQGWESVYCSFSSGKKLLHVGFQLLRDESGHITKHLLPNSHC